MTAHQPPAAVPATQPTGPERGPLTATQQQLWALDRKQPPPAALNLSYALSIEGPLDAGILRAAFHDLVREHEPLHTVYPEENGRPLAVVTEEELALRMLDLSPATLTSPAEAAQRAFADRSRGFSLGTEAPIRASLLRLADDRHVLLLTLHHIAADAWSLHVLAQQLSGSYAARLRSQPRAGPGGPAVECIEHARRQHSWLAGPAAGQELSWWLDRLRGATARPPVLGTPPHQLSADLLRQVVLLPDQLTAELRRLARQAGMSLFAVLLTAFQALIKVWLGPPEPVIGTLAANRPTAESSRILGAHYNTLYLSTGLNGDPPLTECLLRIAARTVSALDRQYLPGTALARRLEQELGWDPATVPGVMFLLDRYPLDSLRLEGCQVTGLYLDGSDPPGPVPDGGPPARIPAATTADLIFAVREGAEHLTLSALHREEALDQPSVAAAMDSYLELLSVMCDSPELPLSQLSLPLSEPLPTAAAPAASPSALALLQVTEVSPVEAVSPVGVWAPQPAGSPEGGLP